MFWIYIFVQKVYELYPAKRYFTFDMVTLMNKNMIYSNGLQRSHYTIEEVSTLCVIALSLSLKHNWSRSSFWFYYLLDGLYELIYMFQGNIYQWNALWQYFNFQLGKLHLCVCHFPLLLKAKQSCARFVC